MSDLIARRVDEVLFKSPASECLKNWCKLVRDAVIGKVAPKWKSPPGRSRKAKGIARAARPKRDGFHLFARIGELKRNATRMTLSIRKHGVEVGILELGSTKADPVRYELIFKIPKLTTDGELKALLAGPDGVIPPAIEQLLGRVLPWNGKEARRYFKRIRVHQPQRRLEVSIEQELVELLSGKRGGKPQWARNTEVVQVQFGAKAGKGWKFPFKFPVPVTIDQTNTALKAPLNIRPPSPGKRGYADIVVRGRGNRVWKAKERLGILELKKPGGHSEVALLQAYAYCTSLVQAISAADKPTASAIRQILHYGSGKSGGRDLNRFDRVNFAAVAVLPRAEVELLQTHLNTKLVQSEDLVQSGRVLLRLMLYEPSGSDRVEITEIIDWNTKANSWEPTGLV